MPVRRRFQHRVNSVKASPYSPSLFLLCDRGRMPSCPHRGRSLTRVYRHLRHKLRKEHVDWTREATGSGSTSQTRRVPARNAPQVQSSSSKRVTSLIYVYTACTIQSSQRIVEQGMGGIRSQRTNLLAFGICSINSWSSSFC
jgi:hypothetical protein